MHIGAVYVERGAASSGGTFDTPAVHRPRASIARRSGRRRRRPPRPPTPQAFPVQGNGSADLGLELGALAHATATSTTPTNTGFGVPDTADLVGTATRESDGEVFSWAATVTINESNRGEPARSPGSRGSTRSASSASSSSAASPDALPRRVAAAHGRPARLVQADHRLLDAALGRERRSARSIRTRLRRRGVLHPGLEQLAGGCWARSRVRTLFTGIFTAGARPTPSPTRDNEIKRIKEQRHESSKDRGATLALAVFVAPACSSSSSGAAGNSADGGTGGQSQLRLHAPRGPDPGREGPHAQDIRPPGRSGRQRVRVLDLGRGRTPSPATPYPPYDSRRHVHGRRLELDD